MKSGKNNFYSELKSKIDIMECAASFNFKGKKTGTYVQGNCPNHGSQSGMCFTIWPNTQRFHCFHCGQSGDVINLVMLFKKCDHKTAVKFLADRAGIPYWGGPTTTPAEVAEKEKDMEEKILVENMLTEAINWYHMQLDNYPEIMDHLLTHYGFSKDIIEELQIGFVPVSKRSDQTSELAIHLNSIPAFKGKIALTGLFSFNKPNGPYYDYFKGRIVFPYWLNGKVVYQLARETTLTPPDEFECYTGKDKKIKLDDNGKPEFIKYKKLRSYDPNHEKKKYISKFIQNDIFMGEDTIRGADEIIIAEGAPDWISAVDYGFNTISPVTTNFREKDFEKLERLTQGAKTVYIINDNEDNQAGFKGALKTGKYLTEKGKNVFLVELPRPAGLSKVDLNEYLKDHSADNLKKLMNDAQSVLEILIEKLPDNYIKALPYFKEEIAPLLTGINGGILQHYTKLIANKTKTTVKVISTEIEAVKQLKKEKESKKEEVIIDPEVEKGALALTKDPMVFRKRIDVINQAGVVGERRIIAMYECAIDSRLLPDNFLNPNVLAVKNAGHFGAGKSYILTMCTQIYPENAFYMIINGSAKSLYYLQGGLKNKCLIVTEGFQFQENNAADSELVYAIRSLISEGRVNYNTVEKNDKGKLITVDKKLEGPTSFITTTIMENLEPQLEDRLFTIHPNEEIQQTKNIIEMTASQRSGTFVGLDSKTIDTWKYFHSQLKPVEVVIPYADKIAKYITKNDIVPMSTRRAFKRVLIVIQSVTCTYQYQREKNIQGNLISEMCDYWMALQIVEESFDENMGAHDEKTSARLEYIKENEATSPKKMAMDFGVSASAISQWVSKKIKDGIIVWCNDVGDAFDDEKDQKKAKHTGKAYLKIAEGTTNKPVTGLPSPFELTGNPDWDHEGKLLKLYDLKLNEKNLEVFTPVKDAFMLPLNTSSNNHPVNIIDEFGNENGGVKVLSQNGGDEENILNDFDDGEMIKDRVCDDSEFASSEIKNDDEKNKTVASKICGVACKYYDGFNAVTDGTFKEFCDRDHSRINGGRYCSQFESKVVNLPDGLIRF